jgi:hypothetical protein
MRHFDNKIVIFQSIICVGNIREHIREHYDKNYHKMHVYEVRNPVPGLEQAQQYKEEKLKPLTHNVIHDQSPSWFITES